MVLSRLPIHHGWTVSTRFSYKRDWEYSGCPCRNKRGIYPQIEERGLHRCKNFGLLKGFWQDIGVRAEIVCSALFCRFCAEFLSATVVCYPRIQLETVQIKLSHLQTMAFREITGAMKTTPTTVLDILLVSKRSFASVIAAIAAATQSMRRLIAVNRWSWRTRCIRLPENISILSTLGMRQDYMFKRLNFIKSFLLRILDGKHGMTRVKNHSYKGKSGSGRLQKWRMGKSGTL